MKRFTVYPIAVMDMEAVWLDTGFSLYAAERGSLERPDVVLFGPAIQYSTLLETIQTYLPKVVVAVDYAKLELTDQLKEMYQLHLWRTEGACYSIMTSIEADPELPDWPSYGENIINRHKGVSDSIYRHLLHEVFRETREWCGHTFSVVTGL
jgi:hypothetical protein